MADRGCLAVVLELAEMDFMDSSGLGIIAGGAHRLVPVVGKLSIPPPSVRVLYSLDVAAWPGWSASSNPSPPMTTSARSSPSRLAHLREVTAILADDDVLDSVGATSGPRRRTGPRCHRWPPGS